MEEEGSRYNKHGDDDDETESVQAEIEGNDDKEVKSNGSEDGEMEEVTIDESEAKETGNEAWNGYYVIYCFARSTDREDRGIHWNEGCC